MELELLVGTHIDEASARMVAEANRLQERVTATFNSIALEAYPGGDALAIQAHYDAERAERSREFRESPEGIRQAKERAERVEMLQAKADALVARLTSLDFGNPDDCIDWCCEFQGPSDDIDVRKPVAEIVAAFRAHGYEPDANCGEAFNEEDRDNVANYIIGQALSCLEGVGAIHHMVQIFAEKYRNKFVTVQ